MLTPDMLRRIRRIEFKTRRLVTNAFAGAYHSVYKGRGMSFVAVRPYVPGDDVRSIDWKVTARTGDPFIRQHVEERELTLMLVIDGSASVLFGTVDQQKRDFAAEFGAALAYMAITNNDRAGLLIFSDKIEHFVPPRKGRKHILRLIHDLLTVETSGSSTDLAQALRTLNRILSSGAIIFLLSDFLVPGETYYQDLTVTARQHEVNAVILTDPLEEQFPEVGMMGLRDAETGAVQWVDTSSPVWQQQFRQQQQQFQQEREVVLKRAGAAQIEMPPDGDYVRALHLFFRQQLGRRR